MAATDDLRTWAMALPDVTEKQHHRFQVPLWQVRGRTFVGIGRDRTTAVFCVTEESARQYAEQLDRATVVRRQDARRSYLGLEVALGQLGRSQLEQLVTEAWSAVSLE